MTPWIELGALVVAIAFALGYRRKWQAAEQRGSVMLSRANGLEEFNNALRELNSTLARCAQGLLRRLQALGAADLGEPDELAKLTDAQVAKLYDGIRNGFPDEKVTLAPWMPAGTQSNPLKLVRILDRSLDDEARYSSVESFCPRVLP